MKQEAIHLLLVNKEFVPIEILKKGTPLLDMPEFEK